VAGGGEVWRDCDNDREREQRRGRKTKRYKGLDRNSEREDTNGHRERAKQSEQEA